MVVDHEEKLLSSPGLQNPARTSLFSEVSPEFNQDFHLYDSGS